MTKNYKIIDPDGMQMSKLPTGMIPGILSQVEDPAILVEIVIAFKCRWFHWSERSGSWNHTKYKNYCPRLRIGDTEL